ncbi:hypothetical protein N9B94_03465 [Verrucomicrobia bacterium]|nr:hypothetical protein [Verrucomicrobiota bacterium]
MELNRPFCIAEKLRRDFHERHRQGGWHDQGRPLSPHQQQAGHALSDFVTRLGQVAACGLAQDVSIWSSQWSVIIMLVLILHMENQRRGIVFGKKIRFLTETERVVRKYHGYIFSWAIVYTF